MIENELSKHLGYDKQSIEGYGSDNSRNDNSCILVKNSHGEVAIEAPRDHQGEFNSIILPKHQTVIDKIVVISLSAGGIPTCDIEVQIKYF